jgi:predicted ATPase
MTNVTLPFIELAPGIGVGASLQKGWHLVADLPLVIIVGLTGVGKSTTLAALAQEQLGYTLLPNRRDLTDRLLIPAMQSAAGEPVEPVSDRSQRFAYTRRYRERNPGGMSHALAQLQVDPSQTGPFLLFDGLRGADEVGHAITAFPLARFVVLHAPDGVRVHRLLRRSDSFDQVATFGKAGLLAEEQGLSFPCLPEVQTLLTAAEQAALLALVQQGEVTMDELQAKLRIVIDERRNYDPYAAIDLLQEQAGERTLVVDTSLYEPQQVVTQVINQLREWRLLIE